MKCTSIRSRFAIASLLILLLSLLASMWIADRAFSTTLRETTYAELAENAQYLQTLIHPSPEPWTTGHFDSYAQSTSIRITLIDKEGTVLFDSDYDSTTLSNHLYRPEVQQALQTGSAVSERNSSTQNLPVLYYAKHIENHPSITILRVSRTLRELDGFQQTYQTLFIRGLGILLICFFSILIFTVTMITRPLERIKALARRYAQGDLKAHILLDGPQELSELAHTMEEMANQMRTKMEEVEAGRLQLEAILDSLSEGVLLLDNQLVIQVANNAAISLFQETEEQSLIQNPLAKIISSSQVLSLCNASLADHATHNLTIAKFGHLYGETAQMVGRRSTKILRFQSCAVLSEKNSATGVVLSVTDMTELKQLEQVRKEFVANVSHELKTPITAIAGFSEALLQTNESSEIEHFSQIINRQAHTMKRIVEDLLLLSSLERQDSTPARAWTQVEQILEETKQACAFRFEEKGSTLVVETDNPEGYEIFVNGMLISQALTNLVINALTYSDPGSTVLLKTTITDAQAIFQVKDNGIGIPQEAQERIFERFYRVDAGRSRSQGGTGLGLSIVKHITSVHNGKVTVQSEIGKGSCFTLVFPRSGSTLADLVMRSEALYSK